jgi:hypothetical protein
LTRAIEKIRVGDRVASIGDEGCADVPTDRGDWRLVHLEMPNPDGSGDLVVAQLARPSTWLRDRRAIVGVVVALVLPEIGLSGAARVAAIDSMPPIVEGDGCVVTGTFAHDNGFVRELVLDDGTTYRATDRHPFYSADRGAWHALRDLHEGEHLRTEEGERTIARIDVVPGIHRVFNLEVERQHNYLVGDEGLWAHNTNPGCAAPPPGGGGVDNATHASTRTGRRGNPIDVARGTNAPATIGERRYTGHALDQMQGRGLTPTVVENAIEHGAREAGNRTGTFVHTFDNVQVVVNGAGDVVTAITR